MTLGYLWMFYTIFFSKKNNDFNDFSNVSLTLTLFLDSNDCKNRILKIAHRMKENHDVLDENSTRDDEHNLKRNDNDKIYLWKKHLKKYQRACYQISLL